MIFSSRRLVFSLLCTILAAFPTQLSASQDHATSSIDAPPPSPAVINLLDAPYLSEDQKHDLRIFHGLWSADDLNIPARRARAALISARYDAPELALDADTDPLDRAQAAIMRGQIDPALKLLNTDTLQNSLRAYRLKLQALILAGRIDQATIAANSATDLLSRLSSKSDLSPADQVEAVQLLELRITLLGSSKAHNAPNNHQPLPPEHADAIADDFQALMALLGKVHDADRLFWPARLAEAQLLYSRDNPAQAQEALIEVLALNPRCAQAWELLGKMTINAFSFDSTRSVCARLDQLNTYWDRQLPDQADSDDTTHTPESIVPSLPAQLLRARVMLRQIEGQQAESELDLIPAALSTNLEVRALQAASAAVAFDFTRADQLLSQFDNQLLGQPVQGHFEVGKALSEARQYAPSSKYLNQAHTRLPLFPQPLIELGLMEMQAGRDDQSLIALEKAHALDPFNLRADNTLRLARELQTYTRVESAHFIVRCKPGVDAILAAEMLEPLEHIYSIVSGSQPGGIDFKPPAKTTIDLMPDHQWFGVRIAGMPQIHTIAASTGPIIAMEAPRFGPNHLGPYDWIRTLRHEFVHTVTLARTNNRIPHWFTEAAAVYLENAPRDYPTCELLTSALTNNRLFNFDQINIAFVRPKQPSDRALAYAQGHWMYEYIIQRFGPRAPLNLMDQYAQGVREEQAFQSVLSLSRETFLTDFKAWAHQQAQSWGMIPPNDYPTLIDLVTDEPSLDSDPDNITDELITRWLLDYPNHPDVLELQMDRALNASDNQATPENAPLLEQYAAARPVDPKPHRLLALMYLSQEGSTPDQLRTAIAHLEYLDLREQYTPVYAIELSKRLGLLKDWQAALAKAQRAVSISPYDSRTRELAASMALQFNDLSLAKHHIEALIQLEPDRDIHRRRLDAVNKKINTP